GDIAQAEEHAVDPAAGFEGDLVGRELDIAAPLETDGDRAVRGDAQGLSGEGVGEHLERGDDAEGVPGGGEAAAVAEGFRALADDQGAVGGNTIGPPADAAGDIGEEHEAAAVAPPEGGAAGFDIEA